MAKIIYGEIDHRLKAFSGMVRNAMSDKKVTQAKLAYVLGITQATLSLKLVQKTPWTLEEAFKIEDFFEERFL